MHTYKIKTSQSGVSSEVHYQMFTQEFSHLKVHVLHCKQFESIMQIHSRMLFCMQVSHYNISYPKRSWTSSAACARGGVS